MYISPQWSRAWSLYCISTVLYCTVLYCTGEPYLVTRDEGGQLRGHYNVCRHHAAALVREEQGRSAAAGHRREGPHSPPCQGLRQLLQVPLPRLDLRAGRAPHPGQAAARHPAVQVPAVTPPTLHTRRVQGQGLRPQAHPGGGARAPGLHQPGHRGQH